MTPLGPFFLYGQKNDPMGPIFFVRTKKMTPIGKFFLYGQKNDPNGPIFFCTDNKNDPIGPNFFRYGQKEMTPMGRFFLYEQTKRFQLLILLVQKHLLIRRHLRRVQISDKFLTPMVQIQSVPHLSPGALYVRRSWAQSVDFTGILCARMDMIMGLGQPILYWSQYWGRHQYNPI